MSQQGSKELIILQAEIDFFEIPIFLIGLLQDLE